MSEFTGMQKGFYFRVGILVFLCAIHLFVGNSGSYEGGLEKVSITYWVCMVGLVYFCWYVLTLKCGDCGEPVIYKAVNPAQWRLPSNHCSKCKKIFE